MIYSQSFRYKVSLALVPFQHIMDDMDSAIDTENHNRVRYILEEFLDSIDFIYKLESKADVELHNSKVDAYIEVQQLYNEFMENYINHLKNK